MPSSIFFGTDNGGRVYALKTNSTVWREFQYFGLDFKKVSSVSNFLWAVGVDRQVYLHVYGLDVPIRMKEECYENERWYPFEGYSKNLLPTDRNHYSSIDGTINRQIDEIRLPSMAWQWEGDWHLDCTLDGQPLDDDGWSYALDFPATYQPKNAWNSYVRRRKWIRFRRYSALDSWCAVAPLHKDPTQEPFSDIAIGGTNIPGAPQGTLSVWAITSHGRVMFRNGVTAQQPEGLRWSVISTPHGYDVTQITVGATGLVWATLSNGRGIVRSGITQHCLTGENWIEIKPPGENLKIAQISVGTNSVWCVTTDNHVWFRRGVRGEAAGVSEDCAVGSGWVEMVGNISMLSVTGNDQVFAVGSEDRALYFRSKVSQSDPTGKKWRLIQCPVQVSRTSSTVSLSRKSGSSSPGSRPRSLCNSFKERMAVVEQPALIENLEEVSKSGHYSRHKGNIWKNLTPPSSLMETSTRNKHTRLTETHASSAPVNVKEISSNHFETQPKNPRAWSPVRSVGSIVGTEAHPETDSSVFDGDVSRSSGFYGEEDHDHGDSQFWAECDVLWIGCSAGAVNIDPQNLPNWFKDNYNSDHHEELSKEWRVQILEKLRNRSVLLKFIDTERYEKAVMISSWTKTAEARSQKPGGNFEDCLIELEWFDMESGTFTILDANGITTKMQFSLTEITCVQSCSESGFPRIAIHAPRLPVGYSPVKLQFSGDNEMEDWLSHLTSVCCQINYVQGKPADDSIWMTTNLGEVFAFDPTNLRASQWDNDKKYFIEKMDISAAESPYYNTLYNGMPPGTDLEITGCVCDDADQIRFDLQCHSNIKVRHKVEKLRVIAMHINPRFSEKIVVLNQMENSEWGEEIRIKDMVFGPGENFVLNIRSTTDGYEIYVDGKKFTNYKHRIDPETITCLYASGRVKLFQIIYRCTIPIIPIRDIFWRQMGGHMRKVITCSSSIIWGIGCDSTAWYYTGGWGGQFLKGLENSTTGKINPMTDCISFYLYENQRWNPLSGFSTAGLPTDRHMWSDVTGKHKRSKAHTKLLSMHWQWISDWLVDFHTPGGVDRDGWQYAVDFPASYHGKKQFTDYVRRRRWFRKCRLTTSGPWQEIGNSKIIDVSIAPENAESKNNLISVWAVSTNGDVLCRKGVSSFNPGGSSWEHVTSEYQFLSISTNGQCVWAVARDGTPYFRFGVSLENPLGEAWRPIESASSIHFKQISAGQQGVWALDKEGKLAVRKEITLTFPEGTHWQIIPNVPNQPPHSEGSVGFKSISVGKEVWAVSFSGIICKRCGITNSNPAGVGWHLGIPAQWQHISGRGFEC